MQIEDGKTKTICHFYDLRSFATLRSPVLPTFGPLFSLEPKLPSRSASSRPNTSRLRFADKSFHKGCSGPIAGSGDVRFGTTDNDRERRPTERPSAGPKGSRLRRYVDPSTVVLARLCDAVVPE
jgi:hypothetical protein